jgi:hypothetical protein
MFVYIEKNQRKVLAGVAILFALVYSILALRTGLVFNSPDENANYFFSSLFASESRLDYPLPVVSDIIHPRSMTVFGQSIVPQSFFGMPILYGILGKIFGLNAIIFFTPIIAVISVLFFYEIIKRIFGAENAFLSSILVFIHPSFWYYSTHSMYHNVLFVSFLIVGLYFFIRDFEIRVGAPLGGDSNGDFKRCLTRYGVPDTCEPNVSEGLKLRNLILGSFFVGLSLVVRSCEAPWVLLVLIILYFFNRKKMDFRKVAVCLFVFFVLSLPILFFNNYLYGGLFSSGYNLSNSIAEDIINSSLVLKSAFFSVFRNFWNYGVFIFWWLSIPSFLGFFWFLKDYKNLKSLQRKYLAVFLVGLFYLAVYYGSWVFHDNPDPTKITIGTSYVRYWLPIYIFSMPFLAMLLLKIKKSIRRLTVQKMAFFCVLVALISYNFLFVFKLTDESIGRNVLGEYKEIREKVLNLTEDNAIIVSGYYDKLFFPSRLVIENFDEERDKRLKEIKKLLVKNYPIYYYSWNSDADIEYLNKIFNGYGLKLINSKNIREGERMFEITKTQKQ